MSFCGLVFVAFFFFLRDFDFFFFGFGAKLLAGAWWLGITFLAFSFCGALAPGGMRGVFRPAVALWVGGLLAFSGGGASFSGVFVFSSAVFFLVLYLRFFFWRRRPQWS